MFTAGYADVFTGDDNWQSLAMPTDEMFVWDETSTYVRRPPYFDAMTRDPAPLEDITDARVLALLGDSVTTDHISPAGAINEASPAGRYLTEHGVGAGDFNSYGSRRGNHEVMIRGTFANIRLRNQLVPGVEGGFTRHLPDGRTLSIYDAAVAYRARRRAAGHRRRRRVRLRIVARLGGERHHAARRQGRAGDVVRTDPSQQPHRHGRAAVAVPARRVRAEPRASPARSAIRSSDYTTPTRFQPK